MGVLITSKASNNAMESLSAKAVTMIAAAGRILCTSYTYNNFDVEFGTDRHGIDHSTVNLHHLTSALLIPLQHGITPKT